MLVCCFEMLSSPLVETLHNLMQCLSKQTIYIRITWGFIKKQIPEPTPGIAECGMSVGEAWTSALLETVMGQIHWVKNLDFEVWS